VTERFGQWIGILANIGVLFGFLAVAYQLQLNRESMQQASNLASSNLATSAETALMGDSGHEAYAKSIMNPSELTPGELVQVWTYMSMGSLSAMQSHREYVEGRISEGAWLQARDQFISYFNYPMGRLWFAESSQGQSGTTQQEFWEAARIGLEAAPPDQTQAWFMRMYRGAKSLGSEAESHDAAVPQE
jgi:hypothetical protein